jgi:hypothetical protein
MDALPDTWAIMSVMQNRGDWNKRFKNYLGMVQEGTG